MTTTRRLSIPFAQSSLAGACLAGLLAMGCGKDKPTTAKTTQPPKPAAHQEAAKPAAPKPPTLTLPLAELVRARVMERCALKGGEPAADALLLAADTAAGRAYQPRIAASEPAKPNTADKKPEKAGKKPDVVVAKPSVTPPPGMKGLPTGRRYVDDAKHQRWLKSYASDVKAAEGWAPWKKDMDAQVQGCRWDKDIGLIDAKMIARYRDTFVAITCLQEKFRDKEGKLDEVEHARAAVAVFKEQGFTAPSFTRLSGIMAKFPDLQAELFAHRAKTCPDPRLKADAKAANGPYVGTLKGALSGSLKLVAKEGKLAGEVTLTAGRRKKAVATIPLSGLINGERVHLNGVAKTDWVRLDCGGGGASPKQDGTCRWSGEIGFKKRAGTWTMRRPAPGDLPAAASGTGGAKAPVAKAPATGGPKVQPAAEATDKPQGKLGDAAPPAAAPPTPAHPPEDSQPAIPVVDKADQPPAAPAP